MQRVFAASYFGMIAPCGPCGSVFLFTLGIPHLESSIPERRQMPFPTVPSEGTLLFLLFPSHGGCECQRVLRDKDGRLASPRH